jgi:hypothetical protein
MFSSVDRCFFHKVFLAFKLLEHHISGFGETTGGMFDNIKPFKGN